VYQLDIKSEHCQQTRKETPGGFFFAASSLIEHLHESDSG
jgi:hypothetical protein